MKRKKRIGISNQLKFLYAILFALSICIVAIFYLEQCKVSQSVYEDKLSKYTEALAIQLEGEDLKKINFDNLPISIDNISEIPEYNIMRDKVMRTAEVLGIPGSEIKLVKQFSNNKIATVLSSDKVYKYGEEFKDRTTYFQKGSFEAFLTHIDINDDLIKTFVYRPIKVNGVAKAHIVLSAPTRPFLEDLNAAVFRNSMLVLVIYFVLGLFFMRSLRRNRNTFAKELIKSQSFTEQLETKNKDLEMLSLIAKTSQDLILITDNKGIILWINDSYKTENNYSHDELEKFIGSSLLKVSKNKNIGNIIKNANSFKEAFTYQTRSLDNNGNEFWAETLVKPVIKDEEVKKVIFIDQNITELMHYKTLLDQKEALKTVNRVNSESQ